MYCPNCGQQLPDEAKFCKNCGTKIEKFASSNTTIDDKVQTASEVPTQTDSQVSVKESMLYLIGILVVLVIIIWTAGHFISSYVAGLIGAVAVAWLCKMMFNWSGWKLWVIGIIGFSVIGSFFYVPEDESESENVEATTSSESNKPVVTFTSEQVVRNALCRTTFKSGNGNIVTFSSNANQMECNGRAMSASTDIIIQGSQKALVHCHGPYGDTTLALVSFEWGGMGFTDTNDYSVYESE